MERALVCVLVLGLAGCDAARQVTEVVGDFLLTSEQEEKLGEDLSAQVEMETPVHPDAQVQAYLDAVAAKVLAAVPAGKKRFEYEFTVLDTPDQVNAFALPGGHIYFYSALLCVADTEAEVAAVLGHEIAHVTEDHVSQNLAAQVGTEVLIAMALGEDPGQVATLAAQIAQQGYLASYSRESESEADSVGLTYMADAGYAPSAMADFFEKLDALRATEPSALEGFFASHPDPADRADVVRELIQERNLGAGQASQVGGLEDVQLALGCGT